MMNKKNRLNIFDIALTAFIAALVIFYIGAYTSAPKENGKVYYTLTVDEMKEYAVNCLEIGTDVYSSDGDIIGTVEEIKAVASDNSRGNSDGAEYNGIYKVKIKISSGAVMSRRSINANGQIIASGQTIPFTSNGVSLSGTCSDVTFGYYDGGQNDEQ